MGLRYYPDSEPGVSRRRCGRGFSFFDATGNRIVCAAERARLKSIAVPPAYEDVWMTPFDNGHLQATGRDMRGRKQYIYHQDWRAAREADKFDELPMLADALPRLRRWIALHLQGDTGERETAIAAVLALLDRASLRPGSPRYAAENDSYGATTLEPRHITFDGDSVRLSYRAKGGKAVRKRVNGPRLAKVLQGCRDLPGATLISWQDDEGAARSVRTDEVNAILNEICEADVTAKTLRTWNGTRAAFLTALSAQDLSIGDMAKAAAGWLHNTPAIARQSYIHPKVAGLADLDSAARAARLADYDGAARNGLRAGEADLAHFLRAD